MEVLQCAIHDLRSYILAILFFKLSCDFLSVIPWKRSCFPPSSVFFFKITYFKRAEKELRFTSRHDDPSAPAMVCARCCRGPPGKGIFVRGTEVGHVLCPARLFSLGTCRFTCRHPQPRDANALA